MKNYGFKLDIKGNDELEQAFQELEDARKKFISACIKLEQLGTEVSINLDRYGFNKKIKQAMKVNRHKDGNKLHSNYTN